MTEWEANYSKDDADSVIHRDDTKMHVKVRILLDHAQDRIVSVREGKEKERIQQEDIQMWIASLVAAT